MSNLATVTPIRPSLAAVERQVADIDDGYTRIANELLEAVMAADLTARQLKVALAVIRKTYGFGKKLDRITNTQIAAMTGIHHTHVCKAKNEMIAMNIIVSNGHAIGINKVISEWDFSISHISKPLAETANKCLANLANGYKPTQLNTKETIQKKEINNTQTHEVGLSGDEKLTPRQKGTNPRAVKTNPRSSTPVFDRDRFKETWNRKAKRLGMPTIRSITTSTENGVKRLWSSYLKQCKELGKEPRDIDSILNGYIEHGYQPTHWALGGNPEGKFYGIDTALTQKKIDEILGAGS
ncbi:replication protein [Klebsiella pneumoniae]|uniref:replication protein n=1 Tax=Klebsiella pneumoniae TaxID=573 RepID=UPI002FE09FCF